MDKFLFYNTLKMLFHCFLASYTSNAISSAQKRSRILKQMQISPHMFLIFRGTQSTLSLVQCLKTVALCILFSCIFIFILRIVLHLLFCQIRSKGLLFMFKTYILIDLCYIYKKSCLGPEKYLYLRVNIMLCKLISLILSFLNSLFKK